MAKGQKFLLNGAPATSAAGFTPPVGQPFKVLLYGSRSGKFGKLSGSPAYTVSYHPTVMEVVFG